VFKTLRHDQFLVIISNLLGSNLCQGVDKICEITQSCRKMAELHANKMHSGIFTKTGKHRVIGKEIVEPLSKILCATRTGIFPSPENFRYCKYSVTDDLIVKCVVVRHNVSSKVEIL
jgi:hypothetical protein